MPDTYRFEDQVIREYPSADIFIIPSTRPRKKLRPPDLEDTAEGPKGRPTAAYAVVGRAGAGKSMFMRHAFFKIQSSDANRVPILIEARSFNRLPLDTLQTRISDDFAAMGTPASREQIANGLASGLFIILLDGLDELKGVIQSHYEAELANFVEKFPLCPILVASRPTQRILSWALDVRTISPLDLHSVEELIARLEFDEQVKAAFIDLVHDRLFDTHKEFVSMPLLCTIMLLTFADSGRISNDKHEFFEDAFTALWSKHDSRKEGFERQKFTGLQKGEFVRLLSSFSISSYSSADYDMRPTIFHRHFERASRLSGVTCREEDFLQDLLVSTSLLVEDGPYIQFCHRSFQEYFAALFVSETDDSIAGQLIEEVSDRLETDHVLPLVHSLNPEKIEKHWVMPKMAEISSRIGRTSGNMQGYTSIVMGEDGASVNIANSMHKIRILYQFSPTTESLRAAYDAARHMNMGTKRLPATTSKGRLFERDRSNFELLDSRLKKNYRHRTRALQELLSRAQNRDS